MSNKAVISLTTGLEDPEKVTVAYLVAVGAAESGRPTLMFLTKEAVRLALDGTAIGVACDGLPAARRPGQALRGRRRPVLRVPDLLQRQEARQRHAHRRRRAPGHRPHVGVDRRRRATTFSY